MNFKKNNKKFTGFLVGLMLILVLAACGGGSDDASDDAGGEDGDRKVVLGGLHDITGGTGDVGTPYSEGEEAYFDYLASEGGYDGVTIEVHGKDYAYDISEAQKIYQEFRDRDNASAILGWGTADTEALRQQVAQDELPFMSASYSEELKDLEDSPYNFIVAASYSDQGRAILSYIKENHEGDDPTVALLYNDTAFGQSPIEDIKAFGDEIGVKVVDEQVIDVTATEAQSQLLNMEKADPDYAIIQQTWTATATIIKDAQTLGLDTQFIGLNWAAGEGLIDQVGEEAAEGYMGTLSHALPYEEDIPGMDEIEDYLKGQDKTLEDIDQKFVQGWSTAKIMGAGIGAAAEMTDGEITGSDIREGLESLDDFSLDGLGADVSFGPDKHFATKETRMGIVKDGQWEAITDYFSHD